MQTWMVHVGMFLVVCCAIVHDGTSVTEGRGKKETTEGVKVESGEGVKRREGPSAWMRLLR